MFSIRFSLKWLMASVLLAAISFAALAGASNAWATAVVSMICVYLLVACLVAAAGAGGGRTFAAGFVIGAMLYLSLWQAESMRWFHLQDGDLFTDRIVDRCYDLVKRQDAASTGPASGGMPGGGGMMTNAMGIMPRVTFTPDAYHFSKIARWLIAFYTGLASGWFARRLRSARTTS